MADLFNLPASRTNKGVDKSVVNKSTNKKSAPIIVKGGGLIEKISSINALVESKLGKYKDDYFSCMKGAMHRLRQAPHLSCRRNNGRKQKKTQS